MDDETPEMEAITSEMREIMQVWIEDPENEALKTRYSYLQQEYQRAFLDRKKSGAEEPDREATHQAYS
jgi:hypothetical protein